MDYKQKYARGQNSNLSRVDVSRVSSRELKAQGDERMNRLVTEKKRSVPRVIFSWSFQIILVIMFAYVLVYFFGQSRTNVGQSMDTTLSGGDEVLINILAYQMNGPARNDIISFKPNGNNSSRSSIKRVIALPGETVQIKDGMIYIDGKVLHEDADYPIITNPGMASEPIRLSDTQYFVLGDNRNNSDDSRFADVGLVSSDMIEGRVWCVLSPSSHRRFL